MTQGVGIFKAGTPQIIGVGVSLRLSEIHKKESIVTSQPIENGSIVSDHIINMPDTLEITAEISNYDGTGSRGSGEVAKTSWLAFKEQINKRELFDVVTHHELYTNMAIESITGDHSAPFKGRLGVQISFKKVDLALLSVVKIPESQLKKDDNVQKTGSSKVEGGRLDPIKEEDNRSLIAKTVDAFKGD